MSIATAKNKNESKHMNIAIARKEKNGKTHGDIVLVPGEDHLLKKRECFEEKMSIAADP